MVTVMSHTKILCQININKNMAFRISNERNEKVIGTLNLGHTKKHK